MMYPEDRNCLVTACDGFVDLDVDLEDRERTDSVVDHKKLAKPESAVHMKVRLSRIGCPDHIVRSQHGFEHYHHQNVHGVPAPVAYAVR